MVKANKKAKKKVEKEEDEESDEGGASLDDAFADDEDVEYAESKPQKIKKKDEDDFDEDMEETATTVDIREKSNVIIKASKPVEEIKRGDKIKVDGHEFEVDGHYVLMNHGSTKEMAIDIFDKKADRDFQLRYFSDQVETSLEFYELQGEIMYIRRSCVKVEW